MRFFDYYLRNINNGWENEPAVRFFIPGKNIWEETSVWQSVTQAQTPVTLFLRKDRKLTADQPVSLDDSIFFIYDPRDPSPTIGGMTLRNDLLQGPYDQSQQVESRPDVVTFTTEELCVPVTVNGKIKVVLWVSSDALDTDFALRLTDVFPDGRSILLREQIHRMRFRKGFAQTDETFMNQDSVYRIEMSFYDLSYTFLPQHKIRLSVSSSNYPRFDLNLNDGGPMYVAGDTVIAHNIIHCSQLFPSHVVLPVDQFPLSFYHQDDERITISVFSDDNWLTIKLEDDLQKQLIVYDVWGRQIWQGLVSDQIRIYIENWKKGMYFLLVFSNKKQFILPLFI